MHFEHTVSTSAPSAAIWQIWTDVARWPEWDTALEAAQLEGPFAAQACGRLKAKGSPESGFTISEYTPNQSYTFTSQLPFAKLHVRRELQVNGGETRFTHRVWFSGPLGALFGRILGPNFAALLPTVMEQVRQRAERLAV